MAIPFKTSKTPSVDSGIGLVMRLNGLWSRADDAHLSGNIDYWNYILDSIYDNLCYNTDVKVVKDEATGKITQVKFDSDSEKIYNYYNSKIATAKADKLAAVKAKDKKAYTNAKNSIYFTIRDKDKWLRTFMHKLGLYLREYETNLGTAMFGNR